ncbi:uncharacterized protein F5891DRAFT_1254009 [Suillus fuscotomentosus]|uniref:Uncharacterized protein n=1 Tax=Suillus fuscotomentosus TaxID=1912939 RepID=A0AAD4DWY1_9AGAM|nr:uncharacterized protein F5891DRAFT_1254009 [Suillus fuscotomentosus]KAG1895157.1 hypothetical protein F5891DRAFT_1254009 [Suillus fuscotomentosus]
MSAHQDLERPATCAWLLTSAAPKSDTPTNSLAPVITSSTPASAAPVTPTQQSSASTPPTTSPSSTTTSSSTTSSSIHTTSSIPVPQTVLFTAPVVAVTPHSTSTFRSQTKIVISSVNIAAVIGGITGCLAGLAVLGFLIMWCIRHKRKSDEGKWSASVFKHQSAILVDDPELSFNPHPPTMIERHNASPALNAQYNHPNYCGDGNDTCPSQGPQSPHLATVQRGILVSSTIRCRITPNDPQAHYVNLDRSSVNPFQAAQLADGYGTAYNHQFTEGMPTIVAGFKGHPLYKRNFTFSARRTQSPDMLYHGI